MFASKENKDKKVENKEEEENKEDFEEEENMDDFEEEENKEDFEDEEKKDDFEDEEKKDDTEKEKVTMGGDLSKIVSDIGNGLFGNKEEEPKEVSKDDTEEYNDDEFFSKSEEDLNLNESKQNEEESNKSEVEDEQKGSELNEPKETEEDTSKKEKKKSKKPEITMSDIPIRSLSLKKIEEPSGEAPLKRGRRTPDRIYKNNQQSQVNHLPKSVQQLSGSTSPKKG